MTLIANLATLDDDGSIHLLPMWFLRVADEICRTQIWQWLRHRATLDDGRTVTPSLVERLTAEEFSRVREEIGAKRFDGGRFHEARELFLRVAMSDELEEFLTLPAYQILVSTEAQDVTETI